MPSSIQSLLDYGKTDGRPDVLLHLHYITSSCIAAQVLYLSSYVKALHTYDYEGKKYIPFVLSAKTTFFNGSLYQVRLFDLFCAPDRRKRPLLLALHHRRGTIVNSWLL